MGTHRDRDIQRQGHIETGTHREETGTHRDRDTQRQGHRDRDTQRRDGDT